MFFGLKVQCNSFEGFDVALPNRITSFRKRGSFVCCSDKFIQPISGLLHLTLPGLSTLKGLSSRENLTESEGPVSVYMQDYYPIPDKY
jgi:hypothetical protein